MAAVTFTEAASVLGFKSRSTLYRLRDEDQLRGYLVRPVRPGLAYRLETAPRRSADLAGARFKVHPSAGNERLWGEAWHRLRPEGSPLAGSRGMVCGRH
jgi:hypothetical protein